MKVLLFIVAALSAAAAFGDDDSVGIAESIASGPLDAAALVGAALMGDEA